MNKLGYSGSKVAERDNTTRITISASPESVVTNYLKNALDEQAPTEWELNLFSTRLGLM